MTYDELVDYCKEAGQTISELDYKNRLLEKENQELKSQLKGTTHCFDEEEHKRLSEQLELLTSKLDEYDLIVDERNQLKKQLENSIKVNIADHKYASECEDKVVTLEAHQKEFIKWLEDEIKQQETVIAENQEKSYFLIYEDEKEDLKLYSQKAYIRRIILEEILQKYKEIIGVSDESR